MEPRTLQYMVEASEGQRWGGSPETLVRRVCTDSRQVQAGDLFLALRGDRFDGHAYVGEAARQGASAVLLERARLPQPLPGCGVIAVENTRLALSKIAARYRQEFKMPLVAVGGSNGKTTAKELLASVLGQKLKTLSSRASFNNDIGVPVTLLELTAQHQVAVLEFGTNHPGELAPLLRMAQPCLGVLTSIGREHLEFFDDLEGVINEEGWLAELLPAHGKLFLNGEAPGVAEITRRSPAPVVTVGFGPGHDWRATQVRLDGQGVSFALTAPQPDFCREFRVPLLGKHQAINAMLATAVAAELGLSAIQVQDGLSACQPARMRLQLWALGEVQVLDDSYNANADSMRAALETLQAFPCQGRRVAVLGDMAELGTHATAAHAEIGGYAARVGVDHLMTVGSMAEVTAQAARQAGLSSVEQFCDVQAAAAALRAELRPKDVVLLKASRATGLERVGEILRQAPATGTGVDVNHSSNSPREG